MKITLQEISKSLRFTLPIILSNTINVIGGFLSMYLFSQLGKDALSAGALIYTIYGIYITIALSFLIPVSIMISRSFGVQDDEKIGDISRSGLTLSTLLSVPCILFMSNLYPILIFFHQPSSVSYEVAKYFQILSFSIPAFFYLLSLSQFVTGISKSTVAMMVVLISLPVGLFLTYGLIFGQFAMPALGIQGAAYASLITSYLSLISFMIYLHMNPEYIKFQLFHLKKGMFSYVIPLFQMGWPICLQRITEVLAFSLITFMMGKIGKTALAAQHLILQFTMLAMMIPFSFSQAGGVLVGQAFGQGNALYAKKISYINIVVGTFIASIISIIFFFFPETLISFYIDIKNPIYSDVLNLAIILFKITAFSLLFDSLRNISIGVLRGFYDIKYPMMVGILACWVISVPSANILGFTFNLSAAGITIGFMFGIVVSSFLLIHRVWQKA